MGGLLVVACGSGGQTGEQTGRQTGQRDGQAAGSGTVRSEREHRQASVMQQDSGPSSQAEVEIDLAVQSEIDFGHRKGLRFTRNIVGDPEAPVLVIEYSDYQ